MPEPVRVKVANDYRQIRVTFTECAGGQYLVDVYMKPRRRQWSYRHLVQKSSWRMSDPPVTLPDVYRLLAAELTRLAGPGSE